MKKLDSKDLEEIRKVTTAEGLDFYRMVAAKMFGIRYSDVVDFHRNEAKKYCMGAMYGSDPIDTLVEDKVNPSSKGRALGTAEVMEILHTTSVGGMVPEHVAKTLIEGVSEPEISDLLVEGRLALLKRACSGDLPFEVLKGIMLALDGYVLTGPPDLFSAVLSTSFLKGTYYEEDCGDYKVIFKQGHLLLTMQPLEPDVRIYYIRVPARELK